MLRLSTRIAGLGAEFFRWEFATAVAGAVLGINPFDEPNVSEAKDKTKAILAKGDFTGGAPAASGDGVSVFSSAFAAPTPAAVVAKRSNRCGRGITSPSSPTCRTIRRSKRRSPEIRARIRAAKRTASTYGVGPRYLHSTGQYHKGGPNTCVAFVITGEDETSTPIPDAPFTFAQLKRAQAVGDYQTLEAHDRRTVRIHLDRNADQSRR